MIQKLKLLELNGYKTFATKTVFAFPEQITAIVGPNGSGKSNISDAIRWVLGEQAYSLLRGKRTADMIFSGSEIKPRASMASASIIFNNEDGWLPIEFSEIAITRRAYRSGENEYLLNNKRVRLKEINELLANSGLAERTYTVIGQGLIDSALSLRPEERRLFFEEAAGIGLFRSRRDEAIRKLDATSRNMERTQDILGEIKPRLKKLEQQVEKFHEYKRRKADLSLLLKDWYGFHWNRLQNDLSHGQETLRIQKKKFDDSYQNKQKIETKIGELREIIDKSRDDLAKWHQEAAEYHVEKEKISRQSAVLDERQKAIKEKRGNIKSSIIFLEEGIKNRKSQLENIINEKEKASKELKEAVHHLTLAQESLMNQENERSRFKEKIAHFQDDLVSFERVLTEKRVKRSELKQRIELLEENKQHIMSTVDSNKKEHEEKLNIIKILENELKVLGKEHAQKENSHLELSETCNEIIINIDQKQKDIQEIEAKKLTSEAQLEILIDAEKNLSGFTSGVKSLLKKIKRNNISGKFEILLSKVKVKSEYEVAIAAALGEVLEGLILEKDVDPLLILKLLEKPESNRTIILPKALIKIESSSHKLPSKDCISAIEVVEVSKDLKDIVYSLLDRVFIVDNRKKAIQLLKLIDDKTRIVTRKGEVFTGKGLIFAGEVLRGKAFKRSRKINSHKSVIKELVLRLEQLAKEKDKLQKQYQQNTQVLDKEDEQLEILKRTISEKEQIRQKEFLEMKRIKSEVGFKETQMGKIEEEKTGGQQNLTDLEREITVLEKKRDELQENINVLFSKLKIVEVDDLKKEVYLIRTRKAVAEGALESIKKRISDYENLIINSNKQKDKLLQQEIQITQVIEDIEEERERIIKRHAEIDGALQILSERINPAEKIFRESEKVRQDMFGSSEEAREVLAVKERHHLQAELRLSRIRDEIDNIKRRITEDFGLVSYNYEENVIGLKQPPIDGIVANLPNITELPEELDQNIRQKKSILKRMGSLNLEAEKEYHEVFERFNFITDQLRDLENAEKNLRQVVFELDELMRSKFELTFAAVKEEFSKIFIQLFGGGSAQLFIEDESNITETGIGIMVTLPGRRKQELASLSGGESSLTGVALIFALLKISPTPFCVLDEVDAMLDETNVVRFGDLLQDLSKSTQFIVITHNRNTVQLADVIYGVTMGKDTTSQVISLRLDELTEEHVE
ncbi:MAG TPA: chromosome segregation protein SMC [Anaerolineae bacterium]|nr:chromosome segregation protein SMC [Anaerolineae bacterium]